MSAFLPLAGGPTPGGARPGPDPLRPGTAGAGTSSTTGAERGEGGRAPATPVADNPFAHLLLALAGGGEAEGSMPESGEDSRPDSGEGGEEGEGREGGRPGTDDAGGAGATSPRVGTETLVSLRAPLASAGSVSSPATGAAPRVGEAAGTEALSAPASAPDPAPARHPSEAPALRHTEGVHPELVRRVERVVERMWVEHGHRVEVVEGHRSQARQDRLYAQGRSAPGAVVTWTRDSAHTRGHAMDVIIDGGWDDLDAFRTLQEVAGSEGIRTLGMRDPGHLELPRGAAGQGGHSHGPAHGHAHAAGVGRDGSTSRSGASLPPLSELRPVDLEAPVAGNSGFRGVARVARVARVAAVARPGNHGPSAPGKSASPASPAGGGIGFGSIGGFAGGGLPGGVLPGALGTLGGPPPVGEGVPSGALGSRGIESIPELLPRALSGLPTPVLGVTPVGIPGTHGAGAPGAGAGGDAGKGGEGTGGGGGDGEGSSGPSTLAETEGETTPRSLTEGVRTLSPGERDRLLERLLQGRARGQGGVPGLSGGGILPQAGGSGLPVGGAAAPGAVGASTLFRAEQVRALQAAAGPSGNLSVSLNNVDGAGTDLRLGMRGSAVSAEIAATDPLQARALRLRLGELRTSLAERGLEPDRLGVRWSGVESAPAREGERGMASGGEGDAGGSKNDGHSEGDARQRGKTPDRDEPGPGDFARHIRENGR